MALAALQQYGIQPGAYGPMGPALNLGGTYRRIPLDAGISPDAPPGVMTPGAIPANYEANTDIPSGFGGAILNRLQHPGILEDVSRGGFGGNLIQPMVVAELNRRVSSGELTQEQANAQWAQIREAEAEAARGRETGSRQFQQHGIATIGSIAAGGYLGGLAGGEAAGGAGVGEGSASTAATGVTPAATQGVAGGIGGGDTGAMAGLATGGGGAGGSVGAGLEGSGAGSGINATTGATELGGTSSGPGTAMSRILDGTATTADWLSVGGNVAGTGLGIAGARNQANAFNDLANKYMAFGAPSRGRYEASMTPGFDPNSIPGYSGAVDTASKGVLARLSATGGNPWGNPGGLIEANKQIISGTALPAIQDYQRLNAGTGGYAGFNAAAPGAATAGIGANAGVYNAVGSGLAGLTNPQPSIYDTLARLGVQGLS